MKYAKEMEKSARIEANREFKDKTMEETEMRLSMQFKEKLLKRRLVIANHHKAAQKKEERDFISRFSQGRNLIQKLMIKSDMKRLKGKRLEETTKKVEDFKIKNQERKELLSAAINEKRRHTQNRIFSL